MTVQAQIGVPSAFKIQEVAIALFVEAKPINGGKLTS